MTNTIVHTWNNTMEPRTWIYGWRVGDIISSEGIRLLKCLAIPVDPHIAYGNNLRQERIPRSAPGTFSTRRTPGNDNRVTVLSLPSLSSLNQQNNAVNTEIIICMLCSSNLCCFMGRYFQHWSKELLLQSTPKMMPYLKNLHLYVNGKCSK